jgi:small subunit ribosomal protein S16
LRCASADRADISESKKEFVFMVKIRLARHGAKKRPYYRIVVADSRCPRDGKFIDDIGRYNPLTEPAMIKVDLEKADEWIKNGAQPTDTVAALIKKYREQA